MVKKNNIINLLIVYFTSHFLIWVLIPTFSNSNLPLDTIEALAWGSNLDWGFDKHPPMSAVMVELIFSILISLIIFKEKIQKTEFFGILMLILSILLIIYAKF